MTPLPLPMLATPAEPFDSPDYLFEVKWDGVRALAAPAGRRWRLWGRRRAEYTDRYPELDVLGRLPAGTVVDGELVALRDGRADLAALLGRHGLARPDRVARASRQQPVAYVLFDLLAAHGRSLLGEPLERRRAALAELVAGLAEPRLVLSEGVVGAGRAFVRRVVAAGHEGVMAKHRASRYRPGQRSSAWRKIKPAALRPCVVIGYTPAAGGLHSLLLAAVRAGALRYVGRVAGGWTARQQAALAGRLAGLRRPGPVVACHRAACWVEPVVYCLVRSLGWTAHGRLRGASFRGWLEGGPPEAPA